MQSGERSTGRTVWAVAAILALLSIPAASGVCLAQQAYAASVPAPSPPPMRWMPVDLHAHPDVGPVSQEFVFDYICFCLPTSATFNFGDGTPPVTALLGTTHTYAAPGTYTATLALTGLFDGAYAQGTGTVVVTVQADYFFATATATPNMGAAPLSVAFTADLLGGIKPFTYQWDFGDVFSSSQTGSGASPSHTYTMPGTYAAKVVVTDSRGWQAGATTTVSVGMGTIAVSTAATPTSGYAPLGVFYTSAAAGGVPPYTFSWSFSDGTTATGASANQTYNNPGTYTAMLKVSDSKGSWTMAPAPAVNVYPRMPAPGP